MALLIFAQKSFSYLLFAKKPLSYDEASLVCCMAAGWPLPSRTHLFHLARFGIVQIRRSALRPVQYCTDALIDQNISMRTSVLLQVYYQSMSQCQCDCLIGV